MNKKRDFDKQIDTIAGRMRESAGNITLLNHLGENNHGSLPDDLKLFAKDKRPIRGSYRSISCITGIETSRLPPANELTKNQILQLYKEITCLLKAYNFLADYPQELPVKQKYSLLRDKWDEKQVYKNNKITYLEFCDCEPAACPFRQKFCSCKDFKGFDDYFDDNTIIF